LKPRSLLNGKTEEKTVPAYVELPEPAEEKTKEQRKK